MGDIDGFDEYDGYDCVGFNGILLGRGFCFDLERSLLI